MHRSIARLIILAGAVALGAPASADTVGKVPVQEGGRIKPFDTYARELLMEVTGKESWEGWAATDVALSMMEDGSAWRQKPMIRVDHLELKDRFALERGRKHFSFEELLANRDFVNFSEELRQSGREDFNDFEKAALETYNKMVRVDLAAQKSTPHLVPAARDAEGPWMSLGELESMRGAPFVGGLLEAWGAVQSAALRGGDAELGTALAGWASTIEAQPGFAPVDPGRLDLEVRYNAWNPFRKAWMFYIVAFVLYLAAWSLSNRYLGLVATLLLMGGFLFHSGGLLTRQYLAGRPPISNLYESLTFIVWGIVAFAVIAETANRRRVFGTIAAVLGSIGLVLAEVLPIERELNPLVAVLRSYWMQYHVTCVLLSYSALTLAAGLAHFHLAVEWFAPHKRKLAQKTTQLLYTMTKIGVTLLATGIILGAVWASDSWGRYWGWDPKETWSLITLLGYIAVLHGRFAGWLTPYGVSVANVACWGLVLFTYYGVNFFLVGLHSYAGAAAAVKLPPLLIAYLVFESVVVAAGVWYTRSGRLASRRVNPA
jgi:cytochrome c-type biogenesis protein CcsB